MFPLRTDAWFQEIKNDIIYDLRPRTLLKENAAVKNGTRPSKSLQM